MISKEKKAAIIEQYGRKAGDTGSPEVQIAILTARIAELTEHLKSTLVVYVEEKSETAAVPVKQKNIFAGRAVVSVLLFTERHFWNRKRRMRM